MDEENQATGREIAAGRVLAGVSQTTLAGMANISVATLRRIEANEGEPAGHANNIAAVIRSLDVLGVAVRGGPFGVARRPFRVGDRVRFLPGKQPEGLMSGAIGTVSFVEPYPILMGPSPMIRVRPDGQELETSLLIAGQVVFAPPDPS